MFTFPLFLLRYSMAGIERINIFDALNKDNSNETSIHLENTPLSIPKGFFHKYSSLKELTLKGCELEKFPRSILKLKDLEYLDISHNKIKFIPIEIGSLKKLKILKYEGNQCRPLTDFIHVSEFKDLIEISQYVMERQEMTPPPREFIPYDNTNSFIIMSYNILSSKYANQEVYPLCVKKYLDFERRLPMIIEEIKKYNPSVVCLQEVQFGLFGSKFEPEFERIGYKGFYAPKDMFYKAKEQDKPFIIGQATFIKTSDFDVASDAKISFNKSPYLKQGNCPKRTKKYSDSACVVILTPKTNNDADSTNINHIKNHNHSIAIVNVHLQWKPTCDDVRADQLKIAVAHAVELAKKSSDNYDIIVCGDYNSYPDTQAIAYINNHPEKFISTYDAMNQPFYLSHLTCDFDGCIDYIYTTRNKLEVVSILPLYDDETLHKIAIEIPDNHHPSDHFPIAAALRFK
ncbi:hypothetical protein TRFO_18703 [Tritrichomonas foetus]|uniref:Endonuclease/exonuclease/phosphatase domain-containing protein n=1 Tax=Tritrichomonas foetus TaxID=1144522 RepID=A0A1J4KQQ8_9EUKA|nr:hypothetical protein TRFO_18703 [Tritrichomonas foetus]|eukprot:OHT11797.1 hypothetical protein TRFO_18703 [Tritrichomonas foetus]